MSISSVGASQVQASQYRIGQRVGRRGRHHPLAAGNPTGKASSFESLLGSLGLDASDASARLGEFMQNLAERLESSGPSGNLINTTA